MTENKEKVMSCDSENIVCNNCKWAAFLGALNSKCAKFERKPYKVYYESEDCPKFEKRKGE